MQTEASQASGLYHYGLAARRQAAFMLVFALVALALVAGVLVPQWDRLSLWIKFLATLLSIALLFTIRSQLGRLRFQLRLTSEAAEITAPLAHRRIRWAEVRQVRRLRLPQTTREAHWACAVYLMSKRGRLIPIMLFDDLLENAEHAFAEVVRQTPHATH